MYNKTPAASFGGRLIVIKNDVVEECVAPAG